MSETRQGLLDGGLESDLILGSDIKNVWGMSFLIIKHGLFL